MLDGGCEEWEVRRVKSGAKGVGAGSGFGDGVCEVFGACAGRWATLGFGDGLGEGWG